MPAVMHSTAQGTQVRTPPYIKIYGGAYIPLLALRIRNGVDTALSSGEFRIDTDTQAGHLCGWAFAQQGRALND